MRRAFLRIPPLLLAGLLTACASRPPLPDVEFIPPTAPKSFHLEGRVSLKNEAQSFSGGMAWKHGPGGQELLLRTPLGQGVAELHGDAQGVVLRDSEGREHLAPDAEALVRQVLGVTLPLRGLARWVVAGVREDAPYQAEADAAGRLAVLNQDGWRIEFSRYSEVAGHALPGKLIARRADDLEIRLVVDQWELP